MKQVALVTGASRGIGLSIAIELAKKGFDIALNDLHDDEMLQQAEQQVQSYAVNTLRCAFDVSDIKQHSTQLDRIKQHFGQLTTLVNNAGVGVMSRGDLLNVSEESYERCMAVNSKSVFFLCQAFAKNLLQASREEGAFYSIVNVTSSNATAVAEARAEYCASKAAAAMTSKAFAVRLGRENISVYDVQPGLIETDMTAAVIDTYKQRTKDGLTLFSRIGTPQDIGKIVATLAAGELPYTTGQVISADAGMLVSRF